jgi:acyl-CoA thioesterase FadM
MADAAPGGGQVGEDADRSPASILVQRVVEWHDVDAAGISHNGFAIRLMESAETALFERLGLSGDLVNPHRRLRIAVDFLLPLRFHDRVDVRIRADSVVEQAVAFDVEVTRAGEPVMRGTLVAVPGGGRGEDAPTREEVVRRLAIAGEQPPELLG